MSGTVSFAGEKPYDSGLSRVRRVDVSGMIYHALNRAHCPSRILKRRRIIKGACRSPVQFGSGNTIRPPRPENVT